MARAAKKQDEVEVVQTKDFEQAKKLYFQDIKPAKSKAGEYMQEVSTAYKAVKKQAGIQPSAMKAAVKVVEMEEAKRDDWLRCFNGIMRSHNVDPDPKDLVDTMERPKPQLVAVPVSDGSETDLADAAGEPAYGTGAAAIAAMKASAEGGDDFTEATEEELAQQEGRSPAAE